MRRALLLSATCVLLACTYAPARSATQPVWNPHSPIGTVHALADAYNHRSLREYDALLAADFRFHFSGGDSSRGARYSDGFPRQEELVSAAEMFGIREPGDTLPMPVPKKIRAYPGELQEGADPEHPDSTCQYRVVVAKDFHVELTMPAGQFIEAGSAGMQVFHLVRGDAALRPAGQSPDTTRWYVRRWLEDLDAVSLSLAQVEGECAESDGAVPGGAIPGALALRPISVPVCPTIKVLCDLPGAGEAAVEVFDVQGRSVGKRLIRAAAAGTQLVEAGGGIRFSPGAYWVRLTQPGQQAVVRMVMVAR